MTIDQILKNEEYQIFDRKSINISATALSDTICAFANADGGEIAIGISDKTRRIEGVDEYIQHLNDLLRAPLDYCNPSVPVQTELVPCTNHKGKPDHVMVMKMEASPLLHANHADEVFLRVGDKSKKLNFQDRLALMYAKGLRYYEDEPVYGATIDDIDMDFVSEYIKKIGYGKSPEEYLRQNRKFVTEKNGEDVISTAAILLFGKYPQQFFPRAQVRFIRFTHFSRNPKIAAFLKDYGYVKEYGEGVDRMCRELEAVGLPDPVFNNSTFILKTIVRSAAYGKLPVEHAKKTDSDEKPPIERGKAADSINDEENPTENQPQKHPVDDFRRICRSQGYNKPTYENLDQLYNLIEVNQIFGSAYIAKVLGCSERTGRSLLEKLRDMDMVVSVTGRGKGMYRFKYLSEM